MQIRTATSPQPPSRGACSHPKQPPNDIGVITGITTPTTRRTESDPRPIVRIAHQQDKLIRTRVVSLDPPICSRRIAVAMPDWAAARGAGRAPAACGRAARTPGEDRGGPDLTFGATPQWSGPVSG